MKNNICNISFKSNIKFCKKEELETNRPKNFSAEYPKDYNIFLKNRKNINNNILISRVFLGI